jgi:hypothetical protein
MNIQEWENKLKTLPHRRLERDEYTVFHVFKNGEKIATITGQGLTGEKKVEYFGVYQNPINRVSVEALLKHNTVEKIFDEEQFKAARANAVSAVNKFWDEFKKALFEYHGIQNHPKREKFFEILRATKHTPYEIFGEAEEWVDLLK